MKHTPFSDRIQRPTMIGAFHDAKTESKAPSGRKRLIGVLASTLFLLGGTASAKGTSFLGGPIIKSVTDGNWSNAGTWDVSVPDVILEHQVEINHFVDVVAAGQTANVLSVGTEIQPAELFIAGGELTVDSSTLVGAGVEGRIILNGGTLNLEMTRVGFASSGRVLLGGGTLNASSDFRVGAGGDPGELEIDGAGIGINLNGGLTMGSDGVLTLNVFGNGAVGLSTIAVTGNAALGGTLVLDTDGYAPMVGDEWDILTYSTMSGAFANVISTTGEQLALDFTTPGVITLSVTGPPVDRSWIGATGPWVTGTNWDVGSAPAFGDFAGINNSGTATLAGGDVALARDLQIGGNGGTGSVTATGGSLDAFRVLSIGSVESLGSNLFDAEPMASSTGSFVGSGMPISVGESVSIARVRRSESGSGTLMGTFSLDGGSLTVGNDISVASQELDVTAAAQVTGNLQLTNLSALTIAGDLDVSDGNAFGMSSSTANVTVLLQNIPSVFIGDDIDCLEIFCESSQSVSLGGSLTIDNCNLTMPGGDFDVGRSEDGENGGQVNVSGTVDLIDTEVDVDRRLRIGSLSTILNNPNSTVDIVMGLDDSRISASEMVLSAAPGAGTVSTELTLDRSLIEIQTDVLIDESSKLIMHLDGTTRATAMNIGTAGVYSTIDQASGSTLSYDGDLCVVWDFLPMVGDTFDLLSGTTLTGAFDNELFLGLPSGLTATTSVVPDGTGKMVFRVEVVVDPFPSLCDGDGGNQMGCTDCPCMNNAPLGTVGGCLNSAGTSTQLQASGDPSVSLPSGSSTDLQFTLSGAPPTATSVLLSGAALAPGNMMNPCFGQNSGVLSGDRDGLRCAVQSTLRHGNRQSDSMGRVQETSGPSRVWGGPAQPNAGIAAAAGFVAGQTRYFQVTHRDQPDAVCMRGLNTSQAIEVQFTP